MAGQWAELRLAVYDTWFHSARTLPGLMNAPSWPGAGQSLLEASPALRAWQATLDQSRQWQSLWSAWMLPIASPTQAGMKIKDKGKSSASKPTEAERAA